MTYYWQYQRMSLVLLVLIESVNYKTNGNRNFPHLFKFQSLYLDVFNFFDKHVKPRCCSWMEKNWMSLCKIYRSSYLLSFSRNEQLLKLNSIINYGS